MYVCTESLHGVHICTISVFYVSVKISNLNVIDMNFPNTELIQHN